jgi:hypothetical protein
MLVRDDIVPPVLAFDDESGTRPTFLVGFVLAGGGIVTVVGQNSHHFRSMLFHLFRNVWGDYGYLVLEIRGFLFGE